MIVKLFTLLFFVISVSLFSQEYISGKVKSEFGNELYETTVINIRTDEKVFTDKEGNYMIAAKLNDELRFVKSGFERFDIKVSNINYSQPLNISLAKVPYLIPEVEIAFRPTGNLKKDSKALDPPKKIVALNSSLNSYMTTPLTEVAPKLSTPSAFTLPDYSVGQGNILGFVFVVKGLITKATTEPLTKANYAETQEFYNRIKTTMDLSFYTSQGWNEEEIDRFLTYADQMYSLARKYRKNFNTAAINSDMRMAYEEYIKTQKVRF
jgi:hypothetical protein